MSCGASPAADPLSSENGTFESYAFCGGWNSPAGFQGTEPVPITILGAGDQQPALMRNRENFFQDNEMSWLG
jgi:hypothetical protein